jgi:hypothetical protein
MAPSQQQDYLQKLATTMHTGAVNSLSDENQVLYAEIQDRIAQKT